MIERTIEQAQDGSFYSIDAVTCFYIDTEKGNKNITFYFQPDSLYSTVHDTIMKMSQTQDTVQLGADVELSALKKRLVNLMKSAIRGMLAVFGNDVLTLAYGTKEHEKMPKKTDIDPLDWYMDQFTRIAIAHLMKNDTLLSGSVTKETNNELIITISQVDTRPIAATEAIKTVERLTSGAGTN